MCPEDVTLAAEGKDGAGELGKALDSPPRLSVFILGRRGAIEGCGEGGCGLRVQVACGGHREHRDPKAGSRGGGGRGGCTSGTSLSRSVTSRGASVGGRKWVKKHFSTDGAVARKQVALPGTVFIVLCHSLFCYIMHQADPTPQTLPHRPLSASARRPVIGQLHRRPPHPDTGPSWVPAPRVGRLGKAAELLGGASTPAAGRGAVEGPSRRSKKG